MEINKPDIFARLKQARAEMKASPPKTLEIEEIRFFEEDGSPIEVEEPSPVVIEHEPDEVSEPRTVEDVIASVDADMTAIVAQEYIPRSGDIIAPSAVALIDKARNLNQRVAMTYLELGRVCQELVVQGVPKELGYSTLADFFEVEVGISYRTSRHLLDIVEMVEAKRLSESEVLSIGWSKAKELTKAPEEALKTILTGADKMTVKQVNSEVKKARRAVTGDATNIKKQKLQMYFFDDQLEAIQDALKLASEQYDIDNDALALYKIVLNWAMNQDVDPGFDVVAAFVKDRYNADCIRREA